MFGGRNVMSCHAPSYVMSWNVSSYAMSSYVMSCSSSRSWSPSCHCRLHGSTGCVVVVGAHLDYLGLLVKRFGRSAHIRYT